MVNIVLNGVIALTVLFLDPLALTVGDNWAVVGAIDLAFMTRGFRRPAPEVAFDEAEDLGTGAVTVRTAS